MEFSFIDAGVEINNFEKPLIYNVNTSNQLRANLYLEKYFDYYLGEVTVSTKSGWFIADEKKVTGLRVAEQFFDSVWREPSIVESYEVEELGTLTYARPYAVTRFLASD